MDARNPWDVLFAAKSACLEIGSAGPHLGIQCQEALIFADFSGLNLQIGQATGSYSRRDIDFEIW